jgi:hypothetical protein
VGDRPGHDVALAGREESKPDVPKKMTSVTSLENAPAGFDWHRETRARRCRPSIVLGGITSSVSSQ